MWDQQPPAGPADSACTGSSHVTVCTLAQGSEHTAQKVPQDRGTQPAAAPVRHLTTLLAHSPRASHKHARGVPRQRHVHKAARKRPGGTGDARGPPCMQSATSYWQQPRATTMCACKHDTPAGHAPCATANDIPPAPRPQHRRRRSPDAGAAPCLDKVVPRLPTHGRIGAVRVDDDAALRHAILENPLGARSSAERRPHVNHVRRWLKQPACNGGHTLTQPRVIHGALLQR